MPVAAIPRFVQLVASIGAGQPLNSVGATFDETQLIISASAEQVGLENSDPDEARILPATRYVETNNPVMQEELLSTGLFEPAEAP